MPMFTLLPTSSEIFTRLVLLRTKVKSLEDLQIHLTKNLKLNLKN